MDIHELILRAKLGSARKDAQVETCTVFAAALFDALTCLGFNCDVFTAELKGRWAHSLVMCEGRYYDSMGEFSTQIYKNRMKIHLAVNIEITYTADKREWCDIDEFDLLYKFYVKKILDSAKLHAKQSATNCFLSSETCFAAKNLQRSPDFSG